MLEFFDLREDYSGDELTLQNTPDEPFSLFGSWVQMATKLGIKDSNAMVLSTVDHDNKVHSRVVLMKEFSPKGFVFYTNYQSAKGLQIEQNQNVSLLFFWKEVYRQVRVEGLAEKVSAEESDKYFDSRPFESRVNAYTSPQSHEIQGKEKLIRESEQISERFGRKIYRPAHWGGYRIKPEYFEFWQGQPNRFHDRIVYNLEESFWRKKCLAP